MSSVYQLTVPHCDTTEKLYYPYYDGHNDSSEQIDKYKRNKDHGK